MSNTVLITGATGSIGMKLRRHFADCDIRLRLLCLNPCNDPQVTTADLSVYDEAWARQFEDVDAVIHLAGDAYATTNLHMTASSVTVNGKVCTGGIDVALVAHAGNVHVGYRKNGVWAKLPISMNVGTWQNQSNVFMDQNAVNNMGTSRFDNFNILRPALGPAEADAVLVIDAHAPLSRTVAGKSLQAVCWRSAHVHDALS